VLQLANNVKELGIYRLKINQISKSIKYKELDVKKCTFPKLRSLELSSIENFGNIKKAFDAVDKLTHLQLGCTGIEDWGSYQQILFRQEDLRSLELDDVEVGSWKMKDWNIKKLILKDVMFPKKDVFQTFVSFIKTLQNVSELEIDINDDEFCNGNNYKEILEHLLNLPSLVKLEWQYPSDLLNVRNTSVESYVAVNVEDISIIGRYFPNIQKMCFRTVGDNVLTTLNSLENLRELKFIQINSKILEMINCPQLQKLSIEGQTEFSKYKDWEKFVKKHPNIEYVELKNYTWWKKYQIHGRHFIEIFEDFQKLKTLKYHDLQGDFNEMAVVKFIGDTLSGLEHLEIVLHESNVVKSAEFLRSKFPHLGCDSMKFQIKRRRGLEWLITLRKF
jgi:hypothetical protein